MLRRILAGLSIASLVVGLIVLVFWWRSYRHSDHYSIGSINSSQTTYMTNRGFILVTNTQNLGGNILSKSEPYEFWRVAVWTLTIPAFWLAITIRRKLPRPGRFEPVMKLPRSD